MGCTSSSAAAADGESWPAEEPLPPRPRSPHRVPHPAHAPGSPAPAPPLVASRSLGRRSAPLPPPPPPPPPPQPPSEKVSAATLNRLRSTFLTTATRGSVYDYYTLGHTLGAPRPRRGRGCLGQVCPWQWARSANDSAPHARAPHTAHAPRLPAAPHAARSARHGRVRRGEARDAEAERPKGSHQDHAPA